MPLSFSLVVTPSKNSNLNSQISLKQTLSTSLSQAHSFTAASRLILNVTATEAQRHRPTNRPKPPISLKSMPPSTSDPRRRSKCLLVVMLAHGYWVPDWETHGARRSTPSTNPARQRCAYL